MDVAIVAGEITDQVCVGPAPQVGYFLVEDAVARTAGQAGAAGAGGHLDIVAQVRRALGPASSLPACV